MKKEQLDLENQTAWIPDSKTPNGFAEVPLTEIAVEAFRKQMALSGSSSFLFPSEENPDGYQKKFKTVWHATLACLSQFGGLTADKSLRISEGI